MFFIYCVAFLPLFSIIVNINSLTFNGRLSIRSDKNYTTVDRQSTQEKLINYEILFKKTKKQLKQFTTFGKKQKTDNVHIFVDDL